MTNQKLNSLKFGIAGGIVASLFMFTMIVSIWIFFVPYYNSMMSALYGTTYGIGKLLIVSISFEILSFIQGFVFCYIFAWSYNLLLKVKIK